MSIDSIALDKLLLIDQYALQQVFELQHQIKNDYNNYYFSSVFHRLTDYCTNDLSAFYLDIIKDRLYVEQHDGIMRRSAQTVCWYILDTITKIMAPILSFTAEEISNHYQKNKKLSIHLQDFACLEQIWQFIMQKYYVLNKDAIATPEALPESAVMRYLEKYWIDLKNIRSAVLKHIEVLRAQEVIKHSLEARVTLYIDAGIAPWQSVVDLFNHHSMSDDNVRDFFKEFFIVSQCNIQKTSGGLLPSGIEGLFIKIERAIGTKCPRCWNWGETVHKNGLCRRCEGLV
jgi:isoleucyl-tRNA synthetase